MEHRSLQLPNALLGLSGFSHTGAYFYSFLFSSKDRIPFLMHDHESEFLLRTTNVREKFPDNNFNESTNLTWEELQSLNAGEWFLKVRAVL